MLGHSPVAVFADGSFDPRSLSGGWAFIVYYGDHEVFSDHGRAPAASNNTAELLSLYRALQWIASDVASGVEVIVYSDSAPTVEGCNRWRVIWRNNGWKRITQDPRRRNRSIPDASIWQAVDALLSQLPHVAIHWCKGHVGSIGNEKADALARKACFGS